MAHEILKRLSGEDGNEAGRYPRWPGEVRMMRFTILGLMVVVCGSPDCWADEKPPLRPITEADSVLAVYHQDWGLFSRGTPAIILAIWPDGHAVWSEDRL